MRDIQAPPLDLYTLLVEVGPSTLVLVEGSGDRYILNEWYPEGDHNSFYYVAPGGNNGVVKLLDEVLTQTALRRAFGIIDRDFRSQTEVERQLNGGCKLFCVSGLSRDAPASRILLAKEQVPPWLLHQNSSTRNSSTNCSKTAEARTTSSVKTD